MTPLNNNGMYSVDYGRRRIEFSLLYCDRKTLEIAVHPDGTVIVKAPEGSDSELIEKKIIKRARWILKQLNYFGQFNPKTPARSYVSGETHLYLGKQYRLKLNAGVENSVRLSHGFFNVTCSNASDPEVASKLLNQWYLEKARIQFEASMERCWPKFNSESLSKPKLSVRRMQKRWGSLSDMNTITLNTDLVRAPKECIDYVVIHELCHLKYRGHSPDFYRLMDTVIPGWEKVKHKLELSMA